jgi:L-serine dehydratase
MTCRDGRRFRGVRARILPVGGGFIEWKGYQPPKKGQPKYPYSTMKELQEHAEKNKLSIAQIVMANEVAVSGKSEAEVNAFADKILNAMVNTVSAGPRPRAFCRDRSSSRPRLARSTNGPWRTDIRDNKDSSSLSICFGRFEENARGHP